MDDDIKQLKVMADYECYPIWLAGAGESGNVDPADLGLPTELVAELSAWAAEYDATLNRQDPTASGFPDEETHRAFAAAGRVLATRVARELGGGYRVHYFDDLTGSTQTVR